MNGRAPGVYIEPADPQARPVAPARTDVAAFVGIAERGPLGTPVRVTSFKEFVRAFGTFYAPGYLAFTVRAFFENGGIAAWIVRAAAPAIGTSVTSAAGTHLVLAPALPLRAGTVVALAQIRPGNAVARVLRHVADADPAGTWIELDAPVAGVDARETPAIDPTAPMLLSSGASIAETALRARNGASGARFVCASPGSWGNRIALRVFRETSAQTEATQTPSAGGATIPVASTAGFARGTFVRVRQGVQPPAYRLVCDVDGAARALLVASADPGRDFGPALSAPLPAGFALGPGAQPIVVEALGLHLLVLEDGTVVEDYRGFSPLFPAVWNARLAQAGSRVRVDPSSLPAPSLDPDAWPADVAGERLAGATDGARMLLPHDLLAALATVGPLREPTLIAIPDACAGGDAPAHATPAPPSPPECTDPQWLAVPPVAPAAAPGVAELPPQPSEAGPGFSVEQSALVAQGLIEFCDAGIVPDDAFPPHPSFRFALVDVPVGGDPIDFRRRFDAARAAIHWPWAGIYDPLGAPGSVRFIPPSGHVAGAFAAMDLALGPHHAAANVELRWICALAKAIDANAQSAYSDEQVNCIRALPNRGIRIYGARTLTSDASWLYVPVRRLVSMIESAILTAMQWAVFEPNNPTLRQLVRRSCLTLLEMLWQKGAFAGRSPEEAYYVRCDGTNNPPTSQAAGKLVVEIGVAPVRPAEFIVFRVGHQHDTLEVFEGAAA